MLEERFISHSAPTLAGLKTANLFTLPFSSRREAVRQLEAWNRELSRKDVYVTALRMKEREALVYVYRKGKLEETLKKEGVMEFLQTYGYEEAGAAAISVLTEPSRFLGSDAYLQEIAAQAGIPVLRKDFTVDAYQIYQAKVLGAEAVLLICALLDTEEIREDLAICRSLGINAIVEAHDAAEVSSAVNAGADIIGVNNRNLKDFTVDIHNGLRLRSLVPEGVLFIAESGIKTREDIRQLEEGHVDAVLIGETLMRQPDKKKALAVLRGSEESL